MSPVVRVLEPAMTATPLGSVWSRRARLVAVWAGVALVVLWIPLAYPRGVLLAYLHHARGHYELKLDLAGGCMPSPWLVWYVDGYNSVSERLLIQKYGRNVFRECYAAALRQWQAEHPDDIPEDKDKHMRAWPERQ